MASQGETINKSFVIAKQKSELLKYRACSENQKGFYKNEYFICTRVKESIKIYICAFCAQHCHKDHSHRSWGSGGNYECVCGWNKHSSVNINLGEDEVNCNCFYQEFFKWTPNDGFYNITDEKEEPEGEKKGKGKENEKGKVKGKEKGMEKGKEKGNEKGKEKGNEKGKEKGNEKGKEKGKENPKESGKKEPQNQKPQQPVAERKTYCSVCVKLCLKRKLLNPSDKLPESPSNKCMCNLHYMVSGIFLVNDWFAHKKFVVNLKNFNSNIYFQIPKIRAVTIDDLVSKIKTFKDIDIKANTEKICKDFLIETNIDGIWTWWYVSFMKFKNKFYYPIEDIWDIDEMLKILGVPLYRGFQNDLQFRQIKTQLYLAMLTFYSFIRTEYIKNNTLWNIRTIFNMTIYQRNAINRRTVKKEKKLIEKQQQIIKSILKLYENWLNIKDIELFDVIIDKIKVEIFPMFNKVMKFAIKYKLTDRKNIWIYFRWVSKTLLLKVSLQRTEKTDIKKTYLKDVSLDEQNNYYWSKMITEAYHWEESSRQWEEKNTSNNDSFSWVLCNNKLIWKGIFYHWLYTNDQHCMNYWEKGVGFGKYVFNTVSEDLILIRKIFYQLLFEEIAPDAETSAWIKMIFKLMTEKDNNVYLASLKNTNWWLEEERKASTPESVHKEYLNFINNIVVELRRKSRKYFIYEIDFITVMNEGEALLTKLHQFINDNFGNKVWNVLDKEFTTFLEDNLDKNREIKEFKKVMKNTQLLQALEEYIHICGYGGEYYYLSQTQNSRELSPSLPTRIFLWEFYYFIIRNDFENLLLMINITTRPFIKTFTHTPNELLAFITKIIEMTCYSSFSFNNFNFIESLLSEIVTYLSEIKKQKARYVEWSGNWLKIFSWLIKHSTSECIRAVLSLFETQLTNWAKVDVIKELINTYFAQGNTVVDGFCEVKKETFESFLAAYLGFLEILFNCEEAKYIQQLSTWDEQIFGKITDLFAKYDGKEIEIVNQYNVKLILPFFSYYIMKNLPIQFNVNNSTYFLKKMLSGVNKEVQKKYKIDTTDYVNILRKNESISELTEEQCKVELKKIIDQTLFCFNKLNQILNIFENIFYKYIGNLQEFQSYLNAKQNLYYFYEFTLLKPSFFLIKIFERYLTHLEGAHFDILNNFVFLFGRVSSFFYLNINYVIDNDQRQNKIEYQRFEYSNEFRNYQNWEIQSELLTKASSNVLKQMSQGEVVDIINEVSKYENENAFKVAFPKSEITKKVTSISKEKIETLAGNFYATGLGGWWNIVFTLQKKTKFYPARSLFMTYEKILFIVFNVNNIHPKEITTLNFDKLDWEAIEKDKEQTENIKEDTESNRWQRWIINYDDQLKEEKNWFVFFDSSMVDVKLLSSSFFTMTVLKKSKVQYDISRLFNLRCFIQIMECITDINFKKDKKLNSDIVQILKQVASEEITSNYLQLILFSNICETTKINKLTNESRSNTQSVHCLLNTTLTRFFQIWCEGNQVAMKNYLFDFNCNYNWILKNKDRDVKLKAPDETLRESLKLKPEMKKLPAWRRIEASKKIEIDINEEEPIETVIKEEKWETLDEKQANLKVLFSFFNIISHSMCNLVSVYHPSYKLNLIAPTMDNSITKDPDFEFTVWRRYDNLTEDFWYKNLDTMFKGYKNLMVEMIQGRDFKNENYFSKRENCSNTINGFYSLCEKISRFTRPEYKFDIITIDIKLNIFEIIYNIINQNFEEEMKVNYLLKLSPALSLKRTMASYIKFLVCKHVLGVSTKKIPKFKETYFNIILNEDHWRKLMELFKKNEEISEDRNMKIAWLIFSIWKWVYEKVKWPPIITYFLKMEKTKANPEMNPLIQKPQRKVENEENEEKDKILSKENFEDKDKKAESNLKEEVKKKIKYLLIQPSEDHIDMKTKTDEDKKDIAGTGGDKGKVNRNTKSNEKSQKHINYKPNDKMNDLSVPLIDNPETNEKTTTVMPGKPDIKAWKNGKTESKPKDDKAKVPSIPYNDKVSWEDFFTWKFFSKIWKTIEILKIDANNPDDGEPIYIKHSENFQLSPKWYLFNEAENKRWLLQADRNSHASKIQFILNKIPMLLREIEYKSKRTINPKFAFWYDFDYSSIDLFNSVVSFALNFIYLFGLNKDLSTIALLNYLSLSIELFLVFVNILFWFIFWFTKYPLYVHLIKAEQQSNSKPNANKNIFKTISNYFRLYLWDSFLLNDETWWMIIVTIVATFGVVTSYDIVLFSIQLLTIGKFFETIREIMYAFKLRSEQWMLMILFLAIIMLFFANYDFYFLQNQFTIDNGDGTTYNSCSTILECFITLFNHGVRSGGGIADLLPEQEFNTGIYYHRWLHDMMFFIIVILLLLNMINGVIVTTFSQIREESSEKTEDVENICFLCQVKRYEIEKNNLSFDEHKKKHSVKNFVRYLWYWELMDNSEMNQYQYYVYNCIQKRSIEFVPNNGEDN